MEDLRYPIGKFELPHQPNSAEQRKQAIQAIAELPELLRQAVSGLNGKQLDTPYREGGWTVRQVTHHIPDSHMNGYIRFKLGLTEECPTIKTYDQPRWAELADSRVTPIEVSLTLVEALHARWVALLRSMKPEDWLRQVEHPEQGRLTLDALLSTYSWHGQHHVAHITRLRERNGW